ncbi:hypothetical protein [Armatimonas sp.]|uniref:hypothetical protein n=1 Tax=Armatimonas sp. TaxID=1872638 RepID=UPI003753619E
MRQRWITLLGISALAGASLLLAKSTRADVGDYGYYQYGDFGYKAANMLDLDQRRNAIGSIFGLPNKGAMYCVPTACMNMLGYIAGHGYSNVFPGVANWQSNNQGIYNQMTSSLQIFGNQMSTDPIKGTGGNAALAATKLYLDPAKFGVDLLYADKNYSPLFSDLAIMAVQGRLVTLGVGWYTNKDMNLPHVRAGGHFVTLGQASSVGLFSPASIGILDPANDSANLFAQSAFAFDSYDVEDVPGKYGYTDANLVDHVFQRTQSRIKNYGSGYIDGAMVIKPKQGLVSQGPVIQILTPVSVFNVEAKQAVRTYRSLTGGSILDIAYDPIDVKTPYLIEGSESLYELDLHTGESRVLPAVQRTETGLPTLSKPQRLVIGGPERKLYVLQAGQITCFSRDGSAAKVFTLPMGLSIAAITFSEKRGILYAFDRASKVMIQFDADLKPLRTDRLDITLATPYKLELVSNPVTDEVSLLCDGSVDIYSFSWGERGVTTRKTTLQGASFPVGIDIDEAGMLVANDKGRIVSFDKNGRPSYSSPFVGMPGGTNQRLVRSFSNYNPAIHTTPSFDNVLPPSPELR